MLLIILPNWKKNLVPEDTIVGTNEGCVECNSLSIAESDSKGIKEVYLLGLKDKIIDDDVI